MSYSIKGLVNAFELDTTFAATRTTGQLIRIKPNGKATNVMGEGNLLYLPLTEDATLGDSKVAACQINGIANVYVETFTGITAGEQVGLGATGVGVAHHVSGGFKLGIALATPTVNGQYIPVLLVPVAGDSVY